MDKYNGRSTDVGIFHSNGYSGEILFRANEGLMKRGEDSSPSQAAYGVGGDGRRATGDGRGLPKLR